MSEKLKLILLSAGGTGGHMFPAAALAHDLMSRGFRVELVTDARGESFKGDFPDIPVHVIKAGTLGAGLMGKLKGMAALGIGLVQAKGLIDKIKPDVVVGFGGYPSVPAVRAAQKKRIPTIIHEQNSVLGKANSFLAPKAERIAISLPHVVGLETPDAVRVVVTGNPVRAEIAELFSKPYPIITENGPLNIFVMGGSLGATVFSEIVPKALASLAKEDRARVDIVQQCREEDIDKAKALYDEADMKVRLQSFFDDVPDILTSSHLVISRSGASTVAELSSAGRPAIFVPYPYHKDQQQKINADSIVLSGGGWLMTQDDFTAEALKAKIETFLQRPETLFNAAEAARSCGKPDAARRLGNVVMALASGWDKEEITPFQFPKRRKGEN